MKFYNDRATKVAKVKKYLENKGYCVADVEPSGADYWTYDSAKQRLFYANLDSKVLTITTINTSKLHSYDYYGGKNSIKLRFYGIKLPKIIKTEHMPIRADFLERVVEENKLKYDRKLKRF